METIDVYKVIEGKNPKLARRLPRWVIDYLRRTIHEREVNEILTRFGDLEGIAFVRAALQYMRVGYHAVGMERLDPRQSYIFMMNHQSWFDIFTVYGWLPYFFKWIMKADLRRIPFVGRACESAGHIFINRESPKAAQRSLEKAKSVLRHGVSVVIFPEGTRSRDGRLGRFKRGGFKIATDLGLPVVPVTLRGCFERMPRGTFAVKPGRIDMVVHAPIDVSAHSADTIPDLMQQTWDAINAGL